jgi:hypothetical protein
LTRRPGDELARSSGPAEKLVHVAVEELRAIFVAGAGQRLVELLQWIPATFGMREVGQEHEELGPLAISQGVRVLHPR